MTISEIKNWALAQGSVAKYDDGQFKGECVSLVNQYCHRVLGVPAGAWGNAGDWTTNSNVAKYFDKVSTIQAGDILVYPQKAAPYGHIAIALNGSQMLDQNGDYGRKVAVRNIWANPVILRRKGGIPSMTTEEVQLIAALDGRKLDAAGVKLQSSKGTIKSYVSQLIKDSPKYGKDKTIASLRKQLADVQKALQNEKNKPPQTVIKEVEKIVEKEVIKEVPVGEEEAVRGFFGRLLDLVFKK